MSTKQRYYKFVGERGFSRLPMGTIDHDAYAALPADLKHIVLHSGAWQPMSADEIKKHKVDLEAAEKEAKDAAEAAEKEAQEAVQAAENQETDKEVKS